jgi:C_GCAxxG_C_C family probable redox protein
MERSRRASTPERINMGKIAETAEKRFIEGYSCSQSVFSAFAEAEGIDLDLALSISTSFGAGGMMVLGLKFPRLIADDSEAKEKNYRLVHEFVERFNEKFEHSMCRNLLGFDPGAPEASERFANEPELEKRCAGFVREASEILEDIIERQEPQS